MDVLKVFFDEIVMQGMCKSLDGDVWIGLLSAVNQPVQLRVLHVAQHPCWVIQFSVVEVGERGDGLGIQV